MEHSKQHEGLGQFQKGLLFVIALYICTVIIFLHKHAVISAIALIIKSCNTQSVNAPGRGTGATASSSPRVTYYIRTDGGTIAQCDGKTNHALAGATGTNCAVNHIKQLQTSHTTWVFGAGNTIQFADTATATYYMGNQISSGNLGQNWTAIDAGNCPASGYAPDCTIPILPNNTWVFGTCHLTSSCHDTTHAFLDPTTILSGINGVFDVFDLQGTNGIDIEGIRIVQPDTCTTFTIIGQCAHGTNNYAQHGMLFGYLTSKGPNNITIKDVSIEGMATDGIHGAYLNSSSSDVSTFQDLHLIGNSNAGWDGDGGGCNNSCETVGNVNISYSSFVYNGCVMVAGATSYDSNGVPNTGVNYCYSQANGGNGDALVFIASGNANYTVDHIFSGWNVQDCLDALHISDDLSHAPNITLTNSTSVGCGGQAFKLGGNSGSTITAYNNVAKVNCRVLYDATAYPNTGNPSSYKTELNNGSDLCRAGGDQWALQLTSGATVNLWYNSTAGYGGTMWDFTCALGGSCASGIVMSFKNNTNIGYLDSTTGQQAGGLYYNTGVTDPFGNAGSSINHNAWYNMKAGTCPQDATFETNTICTDPLWTSEAINSLNPIPATGSPLHSSGIAISGVTLDYTGAARGTPPTIGAYN